MSDWLPVSLDACLAAIKAVPRADYLLVRHGQQGWEAQIYVPKFRAAVAALRSHSTPKVAVTVRPDGLRFEWGRASRLKLHSHPLIYRNVQEGRRTVLKSYPCPRPARPAIVELA